MCNRAHGICTPDDVQDNDNNYCRVREVVKQVMGIDLEYVEEVKN